MNTVYVSPELYEKILRCPERVPDTGQSFSGLRVILCESMTGDQYAFIDPEFLEIPKPDLRLTLHA